MRREREHCDLRRIRTNVHHLRMPRACVRVSAQRAIENQSKNINHQYSHTHTLSTSPLVTQNASNIYVQSVTAVHVVSFILKHFGNTLRIRLGRRTRRRTLTGGCVLARCDVSHTISTKYTRARSRIFARRRSIYADLGGLSAHKAQVVRRCQRQQHV